MRGLVVFTQNSTYVFSEGGEVMYMSNDPTVAENDAGMIAGTWYQVVVKPSRPVNDFGSAEFGFSSITFAVAKPYPLQDEIFAVHTSRLREYVFVGEDSTYEDTFRSDDALAVTARKVLASDDYGWCITDGRPNIVRKIAAVGAMRKQSGYLYGLRESKEAIEAEVAKAEIEATLYYNGMAVYMTQANPVTIDY